MANWWGRDLPPYGGFGLITYPGILLIPPGHQQRHVLARCGCMHVILYMLKINSRTWAPLRTHQHPPAPPVVFASTSFEEGGWVCPHDGTFMNTRPHSGWICIRAPHIPSTCAQGSDHPLPPRADIRTDVPVACAVRGYIMNTFWTAALLSRVRAHSSCWRRGWW